jgi:hypothetical protein
LGVIFLGIAAALALDPAYLLSRQEVAQLKARAQVVRPQGPVIIPESPRGVTLVDAEFRWRADFESPNWRIVLLSSDQLELARSTPQHGTCYRPEGKFRAALAKGGRYYWYAVGTKDGSQIQSATTAILVR